MRTVQTLLGPFQVWEADHLGQVLESGAFWDGQLQPLLDEGDPSGAAIDIGANVGFLTRYLALRYPRVIAIEANPLTFEALTLNCVGDQYSLIHGVAYDREAYFAQAPDALLGWPSGDLTTCPNVSSIAYVRSFLPTLLQGVVLDNVVGEQKISLIKVDAQGCDLRALRGLRGTIQRDRPLILFEFEQAASSWQGDDWLDYVGFFASAGYRVDRVREDLWDYVARPQ